MSESLLVATTAIITAVITGLCTVLAAFVSRSARSVTIETVSGEQLRFSKRDVRRMSDVAAKIQYRSDAYCFSLRDVLKFAIGAFANANEHTTNFRETRVFGGIIQRFGTDASSSIWEMDNSIDASVELQGLYRQIQADLVSLNVLSRGERSIKHGSGADGTEVTYRLTNFGNAVLKQLLLDDPDRA